MSDEVSYVDLLGNAKAAMMAAIEIYNKPKFPYRDECVVILLLNAWELLLKAALLKSGKSIFYPTKSEQPCRTLSWKDALTKCGPLFPQGIDQLPVQQNLEFLGRYRDNAVHFYNAAGFSNVFYALAQTCIVNFRDVLERVFGDRLEDEITWHLLPLGMRTPIDVVSYIAGAAGTKDLEMNSVVRQFLSQLAAAADEVEKAGQDRGRLMTVFKVKLESVKKIGDADVVVGVQNADAAGVPPAIVRTQDPNVTHPLRQKEVVKAIKTLHGKPFTSYIFQAIVRKYSLKDKPQYCWKAREGVLIMYSNDVVTFIKNLSIAEIDAALTEYRAYLQSKRIAKMGNST